MSTRTYQNRYGNLTLGLVSEFRPVSTFNSRDVPDEYKITMEVAEQIALITDNRGIQLCVEFIDNRLTGRMFIIVHESKSSAALAKIDAMTYTGPNAEQEIAALASRCPIHHYPI